MIPWYKISKIFQALSFNFSRTMAKLIFYDNSSFSEYLLLCK